MMRLQPELFLGGVVLLGLIKLFFVFLWLKLFYLLEKFGCC